MADDFRTTLPKTQNVVQLQLKDITIPQILLDARDKTISALDASLNDGSLLDMDSNLAILYSAMKSDGIFVPIHVYQTPENTTSYILSEGLLRFKIYQKLYPKSRIPAIIESYDKDILHRAFIGNMARVDYTYPELAQWIKYLVEHSKESEHSIHVKYHIPRSRITCALFSATNEYKALLDKYPETAITVLERINTALKSTSDYMQNPVARSFVLDHLKGHEGTQVSKGFLDSLLFDALKLIDGDSDTNNPEITEDTDSSSVPSSRSAPSSSTPSAFYRELTLPSTLYNELSSRIQKAIKDRVMQLDDISITVRIKKEALAALTDKDVDTVKSLDIEEWLK